MRHATFSYGRTQCAFHTFSASRCLFLPHEKFDAETTLQLLEQEQATMFMAVPTILKLLAAAPSFHTVNLSRIRFFLVGGEALPLSVIELWQNRGVPIRQGFGMTEAGPNLFSLHHSDAVRKIGSIGVPNFYLNVRLVDDQAMMFSAGKSANSSSKAMSLQKDTGITLKKRQRLSKMAGFIQAI